MNTIRLTRVYRLPALHSLGSPDLSEEENRTIFGSCSRLHGHDYRIEVTMAGVPDPRSGLAIHRDRLDEIIQRELLEPLQGHNLNNFFQQTTGEALAVAFFDRLEPHLSQIGTLVRIRVRETPKNLFEVVAGRE
ncbi:MAG TPA: 6-carboxytetrahydropterin synthase [Acidobacteriota bacterium]|nr:6-carboxytetrahydropterin synthase [Acidobacteriota bacterium]